LFQLCGPYRHLFLRRVTFIGITGSTGKTTTKELTAAVLGAHLQGSKSPGNSNTAKDVTLTILGLSPRANFYVQEITIDKVHMGDFLRLLNCRIGVVTNIGTDHWSAFGSADAIAKEKSKLISTLPRDGTAILNGDDPRVLAMRDLSQAGVITVGESREASLRAEDVHSAWPEPLSFTVCYKGQREKVRTLLHGVFWLHSVLAAIAVGMEMGLSLSEAATAVQTFSTVEGRMQQHVRDDGVIFLRDDLKTPITSIPPVLEELRKATAKRKIAIIGTLSDYKGNSNRAYVSVARQALEVADRVAFVGPRASKCRKARKGVPDGVLQAFVSVDAAASHFASQFEPGDLVLLKGGHRDGLSALIEARQPAQTKYDQGEAQGGVANGAAPAALRAFVGLGNPGEKRANTPHNVGHVVLDELAGSLGLAWQPMDGALVASSHTHDKPTFLIKLLVGVNNSGDAVVRLAKELGFGFNQCVVVLDDVYLPLGRVRWRDRGGDGGHRGLLSVLKAVGTHDVPRMRIGVGRPDAGDSLVAHVLSKFDADEQARVAQGAKTAAERLQPLVTGKGAG
jgi:aminoacyl-tRNA hydrolase